MGSVGDWITAPILCVFQGFWKEHSGPRGGMRELSLAPSCYLKGRGTEAAGKVL